MLHVLEVANPEQKKILGQLLSQNSPDKVAGVIAVFKDCNVDEWAKELKEKYLQTALTHLDDIAVMSIRKKPLQELAEFLIQREY